MGKTNGMVSAKELAQAMGVSVAGVYYWKKTGKITADENGHYDLEEVKRTMNKEAESVNTERKKPSNEIKKTEAVQKEVPNKFKKLIEDGGRGCGEVIHISRHNAVSAEDILISPTFRNGFWVGAASAAGFVGMLWIIFGAIR